MSDGTMVRGRIGAAGTMIIRVNPGPLPGSYTLVSSAGNRKIEFSTDGGNSYFEPTYDVSSASMLTAAAMAPITHVKFTADPNDMYSVT